MTTAHPAPLHPPPSDFHIRLLPTCSVTGPFYRARPNSPNPFQLSSSSGRFSGPGCAPVLYGGLTPLAAFAERCILPVPHPSAGAGAFTFAASGSLIASSVLTEMVPTIPLVLVDLTSPSLLSIGATYAISTTNDYATTQHWATALYAHPSQVHGIRYASNLCGEPCLAVFERAIPLLTAVGSAPFSLEEVQSFLDRLGVALF